MRGVLAGFLGLLIATNAHAYTYQSAITNGCHERIATEAIRALRATEQIPTVTPSANDRALIHDLPFDLEPDVHDLTGASLAVGARDNDLHGNGPNELDALAQVHGNPALQHEHCLRGTLEDEPNGTEQALEDCKQYLREKVAAALEGLDQTGKPDAGRKTTLRVALMFRGHTDVELPVYWVEIGRALHAMADSFAHNYRSADHKRVHVTMNYSDFVNGNFKEERDGPAHRAEMDECEGLDAYRAQNLQLAKQASFEILHLTVDPTLPTREQKMAALETTMHTYLDYEPGCAAANHWCDARENGYGINASCAMTRGARGDAGLGLGLAAAAVLALRRRRLAAGLLLALAWPATAAGDEPPAEPAPSTPPPAVPTPREVVAEEKTEKHQESRFALYGAVSGSISNPSLNGELGARVNLTRRWQVGLDGELNNWYGATIKRFSTGALNIYGTVVFRTPLRFADFNLRSTANIGTSTLLIDLYGAPSGTTGLFVAIAPAGLEWKLSSRVFLILNGISLALPIPKLTNGVPFAYSQYRVTAGVEVAL